MKGAVLFAIALLLALMATPGAVQQAAGHEPILRATIDPPRVVVGQKTTLRLELLVPNYMTAPPAVPSFQIRNAVTRQLQNLNLSEQHDGITYAGVRFEFAIYPQEPGSYAVADRKITVKFAAEPPQTREAMLSVPRIEFESFIPDAAAGLEPFVAATRLTIQQNVQRSTDELKVGGSVTRTVTVSAEGTPAMLLPKIPFLPVDGLVLYSAQPSLEDHIDSRTDMLSASRGEPSCSWAPALQRAAWSSHRRRPAADRPSCAGSARGRQPVARSRVLPGMRAPARLPMPLPPSSCWSC